MKLSPKCLQNRLAHRNFVPSHNAVPGHILDELKAFVDSAKGKMLVLTGAGISTESGIPDYRSEGVGLYATSKKRPIQHKVSNSVYI